MSCGHTTCRGITAVRPSRFGHPEVATKHRDGGDKPGIFFPSQISTECEAVTPPRLRARGGSWEERKAKSKVKVKVKDTGKVKAKVIWNGRTPPPHLLPSFPSWMRGFCGRGEKLLRGATIFSFCLLLILCRRLFRQGRANIAYSSLAATAATPILPSNQVAQFEPQLGGGCEASTRRLNEQWTRPAGP
jgi:hypothetical protein